MEDCTVIYRRVYCSLWRIKWDYLETTLRVHREQLPLELRDQRSRHWDRVWIVLRKIFGAYAGSYCGSTTDCGELLETNCSKTSHCASNV